MSDNETPTTSTDNSVPLPLPASEMPRVPAPGIVCPGCGAKLSNTQSDPGAKIRCLNCGTRFTPGVPLDKNEDASGPAKSGAAAEKKTREPRAAGYWLLRVPTIIYAFAACATFAFLVVLGIWALWDGLHRGSFPLSRWSEIMSVVYVPLLPLSAYLFYSLATALSKIEAGTLKALFKLNLLDDSLPPVPGSSLPYIAPLAVGASCMVAAVVATSADDYRNSFRHLESIIFTGVFASVAFLAAFMCEDLRQFFWRQRLMAEAGARGVQGNTESVPSTPASPLAFFPVLTALALGGSFILEALISTWRRNEVLAEYHTQQLKVKGQPIPTDSWYLNNQGGAEVLMSVIGFFALLAAAWTIYLLGAKCAAAVKSWCAAARLQKDGALSRAMGSLDLALVRLSLLGFAFVGGSWFFYQIIFRQSYRPNYRAYEIVVMLVAAGGGFFACLSVSSVLTHVREWRLAQERYWNARFPKLNHGLTWLQRGFIFFGFAIATVEFFAFGILILSEISFRRGRGIDEEFIPICLAAYIVHFPIFWTTLITRDLLLIQNTAASAALAAGSAADAAISSPNAAPHYPANTRTAAPEIPASPSLPSSSQP